MFDDSVITMCLGEDLFGLHVFGGIFELYRSRCPYLLDLGYFQQLLFFFCGIGV
jgi:hypothetical protein